jgi:hypothetical protein
LLSLDKIAFGNVFQGAIKKTMFTIKNPGTANLDITSMTFTNGDFVLTGDAPTFIKPGLYKNYTVTIPTATVATLEDWLTITYSDGSEDILHVTGDVLPPPAIATDLSLLQNTLAFGETSDHAFAIQNTGVAPLEVTISGKQWLSFTTDALPAANGYAVEKHNNDDVYQWIDIRKTGTQLPFIDFDDFDNTFWRTLELPFPFEFYGTTYTSFKIGDNGIISFEDEPQASLFTDHIPTSSHNGPCIMPYWTFSGFSDYLYDIKDIGIFYQNYGDKFIITFSYFTNNFGGMGDPVSAQVIFYANGTMKFQYKQEEGGADATSQFSIIGIQQNSTTGMAISEFLPLDFGTGLAYILVPADKYEVAPGATLTGNINLNAKNIYGGVYSEDLTMSTNVPGSEMLVKPVELTVTGNGALQVSEEADFGRKLIASEFGMPLINYFDLPIGNSGSAALEITAIQMADASQALSLQVWALMPGWFGDEWRWADISEVYSPWTFPTPPVFTIKPGETLKARATFAPEASGDFSDEIVFTTSIGETRVLVKGTGFEPPVLEAELTPVHVVMNTLDETATRSISFNNTEGLSDLEYEIAIDFGRVASSGTTTEAMATTASAIALRSEKTNIQSNGARPFSAYHRVIKRTDKDTPDTFVGTGGSAPFTLATKYNAGPEGFNLSHVETWFRAEELASGTVEVEIRAGGNTIAEAVLLAAGKTTFSNAGGDENGGWLKIAMDQPAGIYPNEDFYVIVTYPLGIEFPQGTIAGVDTEPGIYYYFSEGLWYNIQEVQSFETMGWLMLAAEETPAENAWLKITSSTSGSLAAGEASTIELFMEGALSKRGDQVANIVIRSNDPEHEMVAVPVTLHMNDAPHFTGIPENITIGENTSFTVKLGVADMEGDAFTVAPAQSYAGVTPSFTNGQLTVTISPEFGDAGVYSYTFIATDEHNASREVTLAAEVLHTNRAPGYIAGSKTMLFNPDGLMNEFQIENFFADPDGDAYSFTVTSDHPETVAVFASAEKFVIKPIKVGKAKISFTTTDIFGAVSTEAIDVTVEAEVVQHNEAPRYIATEKTMVFTATGTMNEFKISDFFADPDGDAFTVTATSDNAEMVTVFTSSTQFIIKPVKIGKAKINFTTRDVHGAESSEIVEVTVEVVLSAEKPSLHNGLAIYPNPVIGVANITFTHDWRGPVEIKLIDATGKPCLEHDAVIGSSGELQLDVEKFGKGLYVLKVSSNTKQAVIKLIKK